MYIAAAHWSLTTISSVGYGDLFPVTTTEMVFGMVAMIISTGVFSFVVGALAGLFDRTDSIVIEF